MVYLKKYKRLIQNAGSVLSLNLIQRALSLLTVYILVRALDQKQFGEYQFILSLVGVLSLFSLPGMSNAVMQSTARGMVGVFRKSVKLSFVSSFIGSLVLLIIGLWYQFNANNTVSIALYIAAIFFPFSQSLNTWKAVKTGKQEFSFLLLSESLMSLISAALVITVSLFGPSNFLPVLVVVLLVPSIQNIIMTISSLKQVHIDAPIEYGSLSYGIKTTVYLSFNIIANHLDKILIYNFLSPASLAVYFVAERMSELTKSIGQNLAMVLAPSFANKKNYSAELDRLLNVLSICLGSLIIVFAFTLLPWFMLLFFGESYSEAVPFAQALLCSVAIGNHASFRNRFVNSKLDAKSNRDITLLISGIRIILSLILVPILGIYGAIISAFIYRLSSVIVLNYIIKTRYVY